MHFSAELRSALLRNVGRSKLRWSGQIGLLEFFSKCFDLHDIGSGDARFGNAHDDFWQHTVNNDDWSEEDVLQDPRFDPLQMSDDAFRTFVESALHLDSRPKEELERFAGVVRPIFAHANIRVVERKEFGVFEGYVLAPIVRQEIASRAEQKLRPIHRISLIEKISAELQRRFSYRQIDIYLEAYRFPEPTTAYDGTNSKRLYAMHALQEAPDETIVEIARELDLILPGRVASTEPPRGWQGTTRFRLFVSHIAVHKDRAIRLKECLTPHAIDAFVAHEDIEPTRDWQMEIERALQVMDAFLAIHTPGFSNSVWTQQEVGFAVGRGTKIISFQMGEDPTGFISKQQALARRSRSAEEIALEIKSILLADPKTKDKLETAQRGSRHWVRRHSLLEMRPYARRLASNLSPTAHTTAHSLPLFPRGALSTRRLALDEAAEWGDATMARPGKNEEGRIGSPVAVPGSHSAV